MRALSESLARGARSLRHNWGLVVVVLATNLALALVVAVPLAMELETALQNKGASTTMMYGFDYDWWSLWSEGQRGPASALGPDLTGTGFALKNLDLLLKGWLPAGLFAAASGRAPVDPLVLGLGALYMLLQTFLAGGLVSVFRRPKGGFTVRGLVHGSGFYFGRMLRLSLLSLAAVYVLFALHAPIARLADSAAREAVSETSALALALGRYALLFAALLFVHMVISHARVLVVREERQSALLAALTSLGFCLRRFVPAAGQYAAALAAGAVLLLLFGAADARLAVNGFRSQLVALVLAEALVASRIAIRLWLLASQAELQQALARRP